MSDELETVGTYWSPVEANLAKVHLEAAGIPAFLTGEQAVAMTWLFANAVGGIKLQVATRDADRALACLAETEPLTDQEIDDAEEWGQADEEGTSSEPADTIAEKDLDSWPDLTAREQQADRALRGAILGLLFFPLQFYVFYLLLNVCFSAGGLRREYRRHAFIAAMLNLPMIAAAVYFFIWMSSH